MKVLDNRFYVKSMQLEIGLLVVVVVVIGLLETRISFIVQHLDSCLDGLGK